jgi:hypothetical protein
MNCSALSTLRQNGKNHCLAKLNAPERAERAGNELRGGVCRYQWRPRRTGLDGAHGPPVPPLLHIHLWSGPPRQTPSTPPALYRRAHLVLLLHTFGMMLSTFVLFQLSFCTTYWCLLNFKIGDHATITCKFIFLNYKFLFFQLTRIGYCFFLSLTVEILFEDRHLYFFCIILKEYLLIAISLSKVA